MERLQKILSARGICSRRKAEEYIKDGLVKVNGQVASLGDKADPLTDTIDVDGQVLADRAKMLYYLLSKPVGVETSNVDTSQRTTQAGVPTVRDLLPKELQGKIYPVGRLDKETSGLLLFTNDGVAAYRLTHPSFHHEKEYQVTVENNIATGALDKLAKGMTISGEKTKSATVLRVNQNTFTIALTEGKNRQIRRMCQKVGSPVKHLRRTRIMTLSDGKIKDGTVRPLTDDEKRKLLASLQLSVQPSSIE